MLGTVSRSVVVLSLLVAAPAVANENEIRQVEAECTAATKAKDMLVLEKLLGPEFELVMGEAKQPARDRAGWLGFLPRMTFHSYNTNVTDVRMHGDIAMAAIAGDWDVEVAGERHKAPFKLRDIWVRRNGQWQIVRRYVVD